MHYFIYVNITQTNLYLLREHILSYTNLFLLSYSHDQLVNIFGSD